MASSKTKYIGAGTSITGIIALLLWFSGSPYFDQQLTGDVKCAGTFEDPCEWGYNITLREIDSYYFQNKNHTNLLFVPDVMASYSCKKDGRFKQTDRSIYPCGAGWREFNWSEPLTDKYGYVNKFVRGKKQEFKIVVFKYNPSDNVKFGGELFGNDFDPWFLSDINFSWLCDYKTSQRSITHHIYKGVTKEFTCPQGFPTSFNTTRKFAVCFNPGIFYPENNSYTYTINFSHFYDKAFASNRTMYWNETEFDYYYNEIINTTICNRAGFTIEILRINYSKCGVQCSWDNPIAQCDICEGDSNCDGILQPGESGFSKDINEEELTLAKIKNWWRVDNGNSNIREKLRDCVEKV